MNNNYNDFDRYLKLFAKYGINMTTIIDFVKDGGKIIETHELYEKTENAHTFPKTPKETTTTEASAHNYLSVCTWIHCYMGFERVERKQTECGRIPVRMISTRPDGNARSITTFKFIKN